MFKKLLPSILIISVIIIISESQKTDKLHDAIALISGNGIKGRLYFKESKPDKVLISGIVEGLAKGPHGMHIHQYGDLSKGCNSTGGHFDAHVAHQHHSNRTDPSGHTGDFGNIWANDSGVANVNINDSFVQLHGPASIVGRALLIHVNRDDLGKGDAKSHTSDTGNSGPPLACGIVAWDG
jgi:Cu-Zn family superoxide dismutase